MAAQVYATEVTADGEVMHVRVTAEVLNAHLDLAVAVETQNADIPLAQAEEKLIDACLIAVARIALGQADHQSAAHLWVRGHAGTRLQVRRARL